MAAPHKKKKRTETRLEWRTNARKDDASGVESVSNEDRERDNLRTITSLVWPSWSKLSSSAEGLRVRRRETQFLKNNSNTCQHTEMQHLDCWIQKWRFLILACLGPGKNVANSNLQKNRRENHCWQMVDQRSNLVLRRRMTLPVQTLTILKSTLRCKIFRIMKIKCLLVWKVSDCKSWSVIDGCLEYDHLQWILHWKSAKVRRYSNDPVKPGFSGRPVVSSDDLGSWCLR